MPDIYARIRAVLIPHIGHTATISGPTNADTRIITRESTEGDAAAWKYAGFVVHCDTCDTSLSESWNDPVYHFVWRDAETGAQYEKDIPHERDAVNAWCQMSMYVNTEPVSMTPEPNWSAYTHDGKTPCGHHPR